MQNLVVGIIDPVVAVNALIPCRFQPNLQFSLLLIKTSEELRRLLGKFQVVILCCRPFML